MRVVFDFFSKPVILKNGIPVVCIEHQKTLRETVGFFESGESAIRPPVFSKNFEPIDIKKISFISHFFDLSFSAPFYKKIYNEMQKLCFDCFAEDVIALTSQTARLLELIVQKYDFDFTFQDTLDLVALFKMQNLKADFQSENKLEQLLNYIILTQKYAPVSCFVLLNMHLYFTENELLLFYEEVQRRNITVLLIEPVCFPKLKYENYYILDKEYCEIFESEV